MTLDETRFFGLSMMWCLAIFFLVVGRCPESASSVSKKILLKSSTSAPFHLFHPRVLVYFFKAFELQIVALQYTARLLSFAESSPW